MALGSDAWEVPQPACHAHARELLRHHGVYAGEIIRVDADAVLYLNPRGHAMTAWLSMSEDRREQKVIAKPGFPAWPEG